MIFSEDKGVDDLHPIDVVEQLAVCEAWSFDRLSNNRISVTICGKWRSYYLTLVWSSVEEAIQLNCSFELKPAAEKLPSLFELINAINDLCEVGAFTYWIEPKLISYQYSLLLLPEQLPSRSQINRVIQAAVGSSERFYPALQLLVWGERTPSQALEVAFGVPHTSTEYH
ncbi:MAG: YbjN domain-containing protein [Aestuariivita sp.]|nr:YbjN domain-containing protein [Aestuariivita sp.]MCY4202128.1 YbjN domain-containing protein [Aestuariivita sp.]MCY4288037.1 YbjN domain-containing protein [Aestuariivita sp.]MCY4345805.1 YbjN domain-containing protein [Aestuariivita sp.]